MQALARARLAPRPLRACADCEVPVDTSGVVALCPTCRTCRERAYWQGKNRRRRAALRGAPSEPYTLAEIAERDSFRCQLCDLRVDMSLTAPDRWAPTIDHVIPLAASGDDTRANVQLAHLACNSRKGATLEAAA